MRSFLFNEVSETLSCATVIDKTDIRAVEQKRKKDDLFVFFFVFSNRQLLFLFVFDLYEH